jgi:hypothetical protein
MLILARGRRQPIFFLEHGIKGEALGRKSLKYKHRSRHHVTHAVGRAVILRYIFRDVELSMKELPAGR